MSSERTRLRRLPDRSVPDEIPDFLAGGAVAHLGFVVDGQPFVIPMTYHYDPAQPSTLYLHGATKSRAMMHLATGEPVCVTVTLLDGLVYSRTALDHSVNYRSVICFGTGRLVQDESRKNEILEQMVLRYFPGRTAGVDYYTAEANHLKATALAEVSIEEASAKVRRKGANGPHDDDPDALGTAGVIELTPPELG
jgi:nitroimidazol reductase NimA-like FMN-containing flavoprotein (pyridoxamine 5'-phosphate oxidase superfamily)